MSVRVTKHVTIMHKATEQPFAESIIFDNSDPDDSGGWVPDQYLCDVDMWDDLGQPDTITVTVEPGDLLNTEDPREEA
jgi:hypothetical protein